MIGLGALLNKVCVFVDDLALCPVRFLVLLPSDFICVMILGTGLLGSSWDRGSWDTVPVLDIEPK